MSFPIKTYQCVCRVCGKLHDVESSFLSAPSSRIIDGVSRPVVSCGAHTGAELRAAWLAENYREGESFDY